MKKLLYPALAALSLLAAPTARAWTYSDGDVLLIFRASGFNDVEFDLGNISQFLNKANGYTNAVTGWNHNLVTSTFGTDLTGVSVILASTTSKLDPNRSAWLSSGDPAAAPYDLTSSDWQSSLWSTINSVGTRPVIYLVPTSGSAAYSIDPGGTYGLASYDKIVSPNGSALPQLGGNAGFTVEQTIPGSFGFWQIQPSSANPKPAATYVGTFAIDATGALTFTAGPPASTQPNITGIIRSGKISTVSFSTTVGGNYWLASTNVLGANVATWPLVSGPLAGDGNNNSLAHTNAVGNSFYSVVRTP